MANDNTLCWPPYIRDADAYEYRKVIIHVLQAPAFTDGIKVSIEKALEEAKSLGNAMDANKSSADTLDQKLKNLNANYEKEVEQNTIFSIVLPLPNELTDTQQHDWNTAKGIKGTVLGGIENQAVSQFVGGTIAGKLGMTISEATPVIGAGIAAGAGMEVQQALGAMADSAGLRKPLSDPGYFQNYTGSQPRTFNMTFDLVPSNPEEAKEIIEIVLKLKEASSPEMMAGGVSMLAPCFFDIELSNEYISGMSHLRGVVLQNIVVNYGADGAMQQFPDGTPKYMQLGLTFVERRMQYAGQFRKKLY